ncbi:hypothetical protein AN696_0214590 [Enterobacter asburiae]|uniref:Uncharacterized protein n=2 Tax=Enterobacterales TaxID=91347 RepID=A0A2F0P4G0_SERMA|nr:hypothetical protein AN699_0228395 [Serratia marcescens]OCN82409.1 hypothetical protein AN677_0222020 [Klebsiella pneumoniae subsp. pneumoniae]OCO59020.1 hypothetical protein AN688_0222630 [Citrobacter freundii]OEG82398.1 hypothetical protein AN661_0223480 [Enterobacter hormaechei subsp. hoffmannii]OEG93387.1 hypothetical protein AN674_0224675 [Enterobacter kobei]OEH15763.1 hypothetical protein AN696_0214590 [Enterobacter asburiae]
MAGAHQFRQHGLHACQVGHLLAHILELVLGQAAGGNDSNLLIVFYVQIMPDDFVMQLHRF